MIRSYRDRHGVTRYGVRVYRDGKYKWLGTFDTEAEAKLEEQRATLNPRRERLTVEQWADIWLRDYARPGKNTRRNYSYGAKKIVAELGSKKLDEVTRLEARQLVGKFSYMTIRVARTMWEDARDAEVCERNPWKNMRLPRPSGRKYIDALTPAEVQTLCEYAEAVHAEYGAEVAAILITLAYTGMRPGELCVLRWSDIDTTHKQVRLGTRVSRKTDKPCLIVLPWQVTAALERFPRHIDEADPLVFHTKTGCALNRSNLNHVWEPIQALWHANGGRLFRSAGGMKKISPYLLRHACATMLREQGVQPSDVAEQLGQNDGGQRVAELYGHPREDLARERIRMAFGAIGHQNRGVSGDPGDNASEMRSVS